MQSVVGFSRLSTIERMIYGAVATVVLLVLSGCSQGFVDTVRESNTPVENPGTMGRFLEQAKAFLATLDSEDYEVAYVPVSEAMSQDTDSAEYEVLANRGIHEIPLVTWRDEDARRKFLSSWADFVNEHCGAIWLRVSDATNNIEVVDTAYVSDEFLDLVPEGMEPLGAIYVPHYHSYRDDDLRAKCKAACRVIAAAVYAACRSQGGPWYECNVFKEAVRVACEQTCDRLF